MLQIFPIKIISSLIKTIKWFVLIIKFSLILFISFPAISQNKTEEIKTLAEQNINEGKFGEAVKLLNRYISANPQNAEGYILRSLCYENRKDYEMAVYDLRSAVKLDPANKSYREKLDRIIKSWETILYNKIVGFRRELKIYPDKAINYLEIGKCFKNLGRWQEAEEWYDEYLKREEPSSDELLRYAEILAKNNHISKGEPLLKKYCEKYPDDHRLWSRYGYFTMWLGKKQIAINAFEKALELRPYFKEALDGYDLARGNGYVYIVNDTTTRFNYGLPVSKPVSEYPIDKYYRVLKKNPADDNTRIFLIKELIKHNRFAEADEQINILSGSEDYSAVVNELENSLEYQRTIYCNEKIVSLQNKLSDNPFEKKTSLELSDIYLLKGNIDSSIVILENLLNAFPDDEVIRFKLASAYLKSGDLNSAFYQSEFLIQKNPDNINYKLLYGQLCTWLDKDPTLARLNLEQVLAKDPDNYSALSTLTLLAIQNNQLTDAEKKLKRIFELNPEDSESQNLKRMFEEQQKANREAEIYMLVKKAREYFSGKECDKAIEQFKLYLTNENANKNVRLELAEAYLCKNDFQNAINIYNKMLIESPDEYSILKQRAKVYYWNEDYPRALDEFIKLNKINPADAEVKLLLGDSYTAVKDYKNAKLVYEELLAITPSSHIVNQRLKWIESPGGSFPVYTMLTPDFSYFADNFDFLYSTYGLRLDFGITDFLTVGASGYKGILESDSVKRNISILKGNIAARFSNFVSASAGIGGTIFPGDENSFSAELSLRAEKEKLYSFSVNFYSMDAVQILYSPLLVDTRLRSNYFLLTGDYLIKNNWKFTGSYSFITVSDANKANRLQLRLGKVFENVINTGYEYYYFDFKNQTNLYWSPENFESHSLWIDWNAASESDVSVSIGGKVGYIPAYEFILREFSGNANVKITEAFTIQGRLTFSTTAQSGKGYTSTSFGLSAFWSF